MIGKDNEFMLTLKMRTASETTKVNDENSIRSADTCLVGRFVNPGGIAFVVFDIS
jgi:hypothetical protein